MKRAVIGVDPGAPLALALVSADGALLSVADYDTIAVCSDKGKTWANVPSLIAPIMLDWIKAAAALDNDVVMVIENVAPRPGEGLVSACKFVGSAWLMRGVASALCIDVQLVAPATWKRHMGLQGGVENKSLSRLKAMDLWPDKAPWFKRAKDHNRAEAALLAQWGRKHSKWA